MDNITIPPEAEKAVARSMCDWDGFDCDEVQTKPDGTTYVMWESYTPKARAACLAMLRAWPGIRKTGFVDQSGNATEWFILPLPQEPIND